MHAFLVDMTDLQNWTFQWTYDLTVTVELEGYMNPQAFSTQIFTVRVHYTQFNSCLLLQ